MVDSVSGNTASLMGRLGLQPAGGRDPVDRPGRLEAAGAGRTMRPGAAPESQGLVTEGLDVARRMAAEAPVDTARVAELREAIAAGRYRIDPERIADAMLRSEPGLLSG